MFIYSCAFCIRPSFGTDPDLIFFFYRTSIIMHLRLINQVNSMKILAIRVTVIAKTEEEGKRKNFRGSYVNILKISS